MKKENGHTRLYHTLVNEYLKSDKLSLSQKLPIWILRNTRGWRCSSFSYNNLSDTARQFGSSVKGLRKALLKLHELEWIKFDVENKTITLIDAEKEYGYVLNNGNKSSQSNENDREQKFPPNGNKSSQSEKKVGTKVPTQWEQKFPPTSQDDYSGKSLQDPKESIKEKRIKETKQTNKKLPEEKVLSQISLLKESAQDEQSHYIIRAVEWDNMIYTLYEYPISDELLLFVLIKLCKEYENKDVKNPTGLVINRLKNISDKDKKDFEVWQSINY